MTFINDTWTRFDRRARNGLIVGIAIILIATIALGAWALRTDYQVLFADLAPQDASTMVAELERMKTPYRLSGAGNTILVPADMVYKTRLKLVGKELPLHGAVGFELFNASEVGMTEFAQKVNYQRALQGELTRTILSLEEIQSARVHLVMSETALFKKAATQAKASITVTLKPNKTLDRTQIQGIQRLVGASVPNIKVADVTIVDQHGVALTRRSGEESEDTAGASSDGIDEKRAIEAYLNKKVLEVLDRTFGTGEGIASVDVVLGHERTKVTTENVLGAPPGAGMHAAGVMTHERETVRDYTSDEAIRKLAPADGNTSLVSREANYQVGRRVEQIVSGAGAINHIAVAVVIRKKLEQAQLDRLKDVISSATGANQTRGDAVTVYSVDQIAGVPVAKVANMPAPDNREDLLPATPTTERTITAWITQPTMPWGQMLAGMAVLALLAYLLRSTGKRNEVRPLNAEERDRALAQVRDWLNIPQRPAEPS